MFESDTGYPRAVASSGGDGLQAAVNWVWARLGDGQTLMLFIATKKQIDRDPPLRRLASSPRVEVSTPRDYGHAANRGPALAVWARMDDLGTILARLPGITALSVAAWDEDRLRPWVAFAKPEILTGASTWAADSGAYGLEPAVEEAMRRATRAVNHNNAITGGDEKETVLRELLVLHRAGHRLDGPTLQGWALANGWRGDNPKQLASYADQITGGKTPRIR
ncbi:MAG: hypothetical protein LBK95_02200 [Bifidobacteriaceae bacterium]|jgi:hypothetical protein|nr:hypothetical protein [Bifidobacteriaceae bacterium]